MNQDKFNKFCSILISTITVLAGLTAYAQTEASHQDQMAGRDSRRYTLEAFGLKARGHAQANFAYYEAFNAYYQLQLLSDQADKVGEETTSAIYASVAEELTKHSPVFKDYFDAEEGSVDILRFESDLYVNEVARLEQSFAAVSEVQAAWSGKATNHVVHLTMLAVSLFLLGQSSTLKGAYTKKILFAAGLSLTSVTLLWALAVWLTDVPDLRKTGAIEHFANGVGFDHRGLTKEGLAEYDMALKAAPNYLDALLARGRSYQTLERYAEAAEDFERAWAIGPSNPLVAASLSQAYYHQGRFSEAKELAQRAVELAPDHLEYRTALGLASLAAGEEENATREYETAIATATQMVAEARKRNEEPPAFIWERLYGAAIALEELWTAAESGEGTPPKEKISDPQRVSKFCSTMHDRLDGLSVALEYSGKPPHGKLTAELGDLSFGRPLRDEEGNIESETEQYEDDVFPAGTREVVVEFPYGKVPADQDMVMRVYLEGSELPSWRMAEKWSMGDGDGETDYWYRILTPGYSKTAELDPGHYFVEFFMNGHLATKGSFDIQSPD